MSTKRRVWISLIVVGLCAMGLPRLLAHGSMQTPASRAYGCFLEDPETPDSAACEAAVALGGTQAIYDWNEINLADVGGAHQARIPDGQLCSAGRAKYKGLDLARADWPATQLVAQTQTTFVYSATAPHRGTFDFYITRDGYNPTQPLKWSDLESTPFLKVTDPALVNKTYVMQGVIPAKQGRHLIYTIWQRSDSLEAFYSCSDVVFGTVQPTSLPPTATQPSSGCTAQAWNASAVYVGGMVVAHNSHTWQAQWWNQGQEPGTTGQWGAWHDLGFCSGSPTPTIPTATPNAPTATPSVPTATPVSGTVAWQPGIYYAIGTRVSYNNRSYSCLQAHTSMNGWEPANVPALWKLQ